MKIEITHQIRMPYSNEYLNAGTKLLVEDVRGSYYVCRTDNDTVICVHKEDCEVVEK